MATIVKGKNSKKPYTVRYQTPEHSSTCPPTCMKDMHQREKSFARAKEANDFKAKYEHDIREQIFVDPKVAGEKFRNTAAGWLERHPGRPKTKANYQTMLRLHILPAFGERKLSEVANDREGLQTFLFVTMPKNEQGASQVRQAYMIINAIVNDAIKLGKLTRSRIKGMPLPPSPRTKADDFVFPEKEQITKLAFGLPEPYGLAVYLMRGCGLRISEALGVRETDLREGGTVLRLARQRSADGKSDVPLKARSEGDFRDVPVPAYVHVHIVAARAESPLEYVQLFPYGYAGSRRGFTEHFSKSRDAAGISKNFTPHSLRHVFASVALANKVPITDVSRWLGHRNIQTTYSTYSHFIPSSWDTAREALDREWTGD